MTTTRVHLLIVLALLAAASTTAARQPPSADGAASESELQAAIGRLGDLDYESRSGAARVVRRTNPAIAVPALLHAVDAHEDGYVRYRALVLATGFNDPRTKAAMREALGSPNDRLRSVAYSFFEHEPDPAVLPDLLLALEREFAEFVRPSLVRAIAAQKSEEAAPALLKEAGRGEDFFRSAVVEALGDHRAEYAFDAIRAIAAIDGPLQDDAVLALGKIGDERALPFLAALEKTAPKTRGPAIAAATCLLGADCRRREAELADALVVAQGTAGEQELLRSAAAGLGALGIAGRVTAVEMLFRAGLPSRDPARAPIALALGAVALRNTAVLLSVLAPMPQRDEAIALIAEGFDMLEEDLHKERFFAHVRRHYWDAVDPASRQLMQTLVTRLDF